jgi:hypothetical protein
MKTTRGFACTACTSVISDSAAILHWCDLQQTYFVDKLASVVTKPSLLSDRPSGDSDLS